MKKLSIFLFLTLFMFQTALFAETPAPQPAQPSTLKMTGIAVRNFGSKVADTFFTYTFLVLQKVGIA